MVVPKFVAEWIEEGKRSGWHLQKALSRLDDDEKEQITPSTVNDWILDNQYDFIKALHDGYEIEKEEDTDE